ncbi:hypothetical protein ROTAS13_04647 [Roseomonas sp. TAS13]|nr:hypothetical protein ROTAS13_04647 [Roseomonas sp. TAS13]
MVASPASSEVSVSPSTATSPRRQASPWPRSRSSGARIASHPAISASTAAKLIWKEGPSSAAGCQASTSAAARAKARSDTTRRPSSIASVARAAMARERSIGTCEPVSTV